MFAALLAACMWSISSTTGARAARHLGGPAANRWRLTFAVPLLGIYVLAVGAQLASPALWWFVLSGAIGMGLGDLFIFAAYERIGARLPVLFTHCLAGPAAATLEWWWLGAGLSGAEIALCALILAGVVVALVPGLRVTSSGARLRMGVILSVASALAVGISAVVIRKAYAVDGPAQQLDGLAAAFLRVLGGVAISYLLLPASTLGAHLTRTMTDRLSRHPQESAPAHARSWRKGLPWLISSALCGPTLGMGCYQYALAHEKAGLVHAVLAILPILVMPLAWFLEEDRPTPWAILGGGMAVTGAIWMALIHG